MDKDKRLGEVIRVQKRQNNFVMMDKGFLENVNLSWKAKGILAYLLSKPDNWRVIVGNLVNHATDGKASVYNGLNELKEQGHYAKYPVRDESGRRISHWEGTISELPIESLENTDVSLLTDFQEIDNQDIENQDIENRTLINNYINNNDFNNNHVSQSPSDGHDLTETIKQNIDYHSFTISHAADQELVDEIILIMIDCMLSKGEYVRIMGEDKPRELVKNVLLKLDYWNIEHVIERFKSVTEPITNKRQYILTLLYNSKMETDSHMTNLVISDLYGQ